MRIVVVGTGTIGSAVAKLLKAHGHEAVSVGRRSGDHQADITSPASLKKLFSGIGPFDAVASAAGEVVFAPLDQITHEQWMHSISSKAMGQINLVLAALPHISDGGSFTLISGVLTDEFIKGGSCATSMNCMVEGFVRAAAVELPRGLRINCISPTVLSESAGYHPFFPGFLHVPASEVALAYLRAISTPITGRILKLHRTNS
jgi:NAD(P)-dependent dehydrogenase (short-subunit alcohol dehydrogenase family)